jgi:hypothetical protein
MSDRTEVHDAHPNRCPARTHNDLKLVCNLLAGHDADGYGHYDTNSGACWWPEEETPGPHPFRRRDRCPARPDPEGQPHEFWSTDPLRELPACLYCGATGRVDSRETVDP